MHFDFQTWEVIVIIACALICSFIWFYKLPKDKKIAQVKEWLKWAVVEAEKFLGSGTGQLKLHYVYDLAIKQFPWLVYVCSFETFEAWVDEALEWMKTQIDVNVKISNFISLAN